jgi:nitrogen fixation protein NifX
MTPISKDIALRIALAARALPDTDAARLLKVLADAMEFPPTHAGLSALTVKNLKAAAGGEFAEMDAAYLKQALTLLKGEDDIVPTLELPQPEPYSDGDMPDSIRIACTSNKGEQLDGHFGSCERFLIYQLDQNELRLVDVRPAKAAEGDEGDEADKNTHRAKLISDCQVLFVVSIGGPAAAKVVRAGVHPMKVADGGNCREHLQAMQRVIASAPPPWLAKAMGRSAEERVRFERRYAEGE